MSKIEEVYYKLKKDDFENKLIFNSENEFIELNVDNKSKIIAYDDYVVIILEGSEVTHFHPDYDKMYLYFLKILKNEEKLPTKKEIRNKQLRINLIFIMLILIVYTCVDSFELGNFLIFFALIFIVIVFILIFLVSKNKEKI